ncbi:MAG: signal peptidase I [Turicibacter sp.]|nr:signal peptidase I [Turicibacter sp.]
MLTKNIKNPIVKNLVEWLIAIIAAFILFLFIRTFIFRVADVNGHSMEPTLSHGDFVILSRLGFVFGEPRVGDIIAFPFRGNPSEYYIKRIMAVPGDVVDFSDNQFIINGEIPTYVFAQIDLFSMGNRGFPLTIGEDEFFVLGDNRNASKDSRYEEVGSIRERDMLGRVVIRFWPFNRFGRV